jgi:regulator of sigma E protease
MLDTREVDGAVGPTGLTGAFDRKSIGARMAITAAGPAFNLIFTLAAFWLMFVIGKPDFLPVVGPVDHIAASSGFEPGDRIVAIAGKPVETWTDASLSVLMASMDRRDLVIDVTDTGGASRQRTLTLSKLPADVDERELATQIGLSPRPWPVPAVIGTVTADSAASRAHLQAGDRIVTIGGDAIKDWREVPDAIQRHAAANHPLELSIERAGQTLALSVQPTLKPADAAEGGTPKQQWLLGIGARAVDPHYDATLRYGPLAAIPKAFGETWKQTRDTLGMLGRMVSGQASLKNLSGVITIAQAANSSAQLGPAWFLNFLAIISLSLAILNLLPIPILDGGGLLYYLIELIKGSPLSERVQVTGQYVGLVLLMALMSLALYNDILRNLS